MKKLDYIAQSIPKYITANYTTTSNSIVRELILMGENGWELVSKEDSFNGKDWDCIFKREITE